MAVAFVQTVAAWGANGGAPQTSGAFTPTATNFLTVANWFTGASGKTLAYSGSVNNPTIGTTINDATQGTTFGIAGVNNITGGSQTLTVDTNPTAGGVGVNGYAREYSSVGSTAYSGASTNGTTAGVGAAVTVAAGSIVTAFCTISSGTGTSITASASGGVTPTNVVNGTDGTFNYCIADWVGTGGAITPTFSSSTNGTYVVVQVLMSAAGPIINTQPFNVYLAPEQTGVFSVSATTSGGSLTYQWQDNRTGSFANVTDGTGAASATYITGPLGFGAQGRLYQVLVTDSNGTTTSATASVTELENDSANILRRTRNHQGGIVMGLNILEWF